MNKGDFHMHTTASDGTLSPTEVVNLAKSNEVDVISITDHDNTEGVEEAITAGEYLDVKVIPGVELSTLYNGESIHILGYFKDKAYKNEELQNFFKSVVENRINRAKKIVSNLKKYFDIVIDYDKVAEQAQGVVARPHIAKAIIESGYPFTYNQIFDEMLSNSSPAYEPAMKLSTEEGIKLLKSYDALVVLAHPVLIRKISIAEILKLPFDGIEARYVQNTPKDTSKFLSMARKYNLLVSAGSDFHTNDKMDTKHGTIGTCSLTDGELKDFLSRLI